MGRRSAVVLSIVWLSSAAFPAATAAQRFKLPRALYYLGAVRSTLNKPAEARQAFERFVALAPSRYATQIADAKRRLDALP